MRRSVQPNCPRAMIAASSRRSRCWPCRRRDHGPYRRVNVLSAYSLWPFFRCPCMAGFGCPPRGGNVTGVSWHHAELATKWLQLMIELLPRAKQILVLWDSTNPPDVVARPSLETAAAQVKTRLDFVEARDAAGYELALRAGADRHADGVIVLPSSRAYIHRGHLAEAALKNRLPTVHGFRGFVDAGGLLTYTPRQSELARQAAGYVDRILKGAKPADLPVEQPNTFELVINMKTAKALGLTIPQSLLIRADQVIE